jgi:isopentenyl-diphosphate delta-isomerase
MAEQVILVDQNDIEVGTAEKLAAHAEGQLHRAFSVFVMNAGGALLMQKRSGSKYHSGGLWSNTCCSHPRPGETIAAAAHRRLQEEMGFDCELRPAFSFTYCAPVSNGLIEHELDHVLFGRFDGEPRPDPGEVDAWRWASFPELRAQVGVHPERFSIWLRIALEELRSRGMLA